MKFQKKEFIPILCVITYVQAVFSDPVREKTYEALLKLCKDEFNIPVAGRSNVENAVVVKLRKVLKSYCVKIEQEKFPLNAMYHKTLQKGAMHHFF